LFFFSRLWRGKPACGEDLPLAARQVAALRLDESGPVLFLPPAARIFAALRLDEKFHVLFP
jgi:hypothetical protein